MDTYWISTLKMRDFFRRKVRIHMYIVLLFIVVFILLFCTHIRNLRHKQMLLNRFISYDKFVSLYTISIFFPQPIIFQNYLFILFSCTKSCQMLKNWIKESMIPKIISKNYQKCFRYFVPWELEKISCIISTWQGIWLINACAKNSAVFSNFFQSRFHHNFTVFIVKINTQWKWVEHLCSKYNYQILLTYWELEASSVYRLNVMNKSCGISHTLRKNVNLKLGRMNWKLKILYW